MENTVSVLTHYVCAQATYLEVMNQLHKRMLSQLTLDNKNYFCISSPSACKSDKCIHFLDTQGCVLVYMCLTKTKMYDLLILNTFMAATRFKDILHNYDDEFYVLI